MVTYAGIDTYNAGNLYGPGGCALPWTAGICIDWTHGVASGPLPALFLDFGSFPDTYGSPAAGSYALGNYNVGLSGLCIDLLDGVEPPLLAAGCIVDL